MVIHTLSLSHTHSLSLSLSLYSFSLYLQCSQTYIFSFNLFQSLLSFFQSYFVLKWSPNINSLFLSHSFNLSCTPSIYLSCSHMFSLCTHVVSYNVAKHTVTVSLYSFNLSLLLQFLFLSITHYLFVLMWSPTMYPNTNSLFLFHSFLYSFNLSSLQSYTTYLLQHRNGDLTKR